MAWNPSPEVAEARNIARRFGKDQVIVIMLDLERGTIESVTYGRTKALCADAKRLGDVAYDAVRLEFVVGGGSKGDMI